MTFPLEGVRVLDLGQIYNGPYAGFLLAMAGADVIKVEPPTGDKLRGPKGKTPMAFAMLNSNKRSIAIDLKSEGGQALFKSLVPQVDVVLENFAPGVMDKLGIGYKVLKSLHPQLIYASGSGYGLTGPSKDQLAMDHTIQAVSGMMSVTGFEDGPPLRAGGAPIDILGGTHLYAGIATAIARKALHGEGGLVEVSMLESMYFVFSSDFTAFHATGKLPERKGNRSPAGVVPYSVYPCSDGYIALIVVAEHHWERLCELIGRSDLLRDPDMSTRAGRLKREGELNDIIGAWTAKRTRQEAFDAMREARLPIAPVRDLDELRNDPHLIERGMVEWREHPDMGRIALANSPLRFPDAGMQDIRFFPELGEHTDAVLEELLGLDARAIEELRATEIC
ncbi:MAG: CoA transferase [Pseudomonadota bacterium]